MRHRAARLASQEDQPQHGPPDHFEDTTEVEDVAADSNVDAKVEDVASTHDSNLEVDAESTEPSRVDKIVVSTFVERWHLETNTVHMPFVAGSHNNLNMLGQSPVFNELLRGQAPQITYEINNTVYSGGYYLEDGIY
ncbi:hypothetical protein L3X38_037979 [Prunus dulcis]|uniref:Uncharacterized protein n=1 Tax=Prunus dulcis TaxID=3755 RepID=A0AAD4V6M6_PRUDU|nr:hypothetical protein L3X38_037979 [Prunus dulcis]